MDRQAQDYAAAAMAYAQAQQQQPPPPPPPQYGFHPQAQAQYPHHPHAAPPYAAPLPQYAPYPRAMPPQQQLYPHIPPHQQPPPYGAHPPPHVMSTPSPPPHPYMHPPFESAPPPPPASPPSDPELQKRIDKLVEYIAKNGPEFEVVIRDKQHDNPDYAFVFGGEGHAYYRYKLWVTARPPVAPYPPGSMHMMPPMGPMMRGPPMHQPAYPPFYDQYEAAAKPFKGLSGPLPPDVAAELHEVLTNLNGTKESIKGAKTWFMQRSPFALALAEAFQERVFALEDSERQLHIIFLVNDILFEGLQRRTNLRDLDNEALSFQSVLGSMLARIYSNPQSKDDNQTHLEKILQFWGSKEVYDQETIANLEREMKGGVSNPLAPRHVSPDPSTFSVNLQDCTARTAAERNMGLERRAREMGSTGGGSPDQEDQAGAGGAAPVCVTGATGYVGSWLVRTLLRRGRHVHATARDTGKAWRMLSAVEGKERLRVFWADMGEEGSFDNAVRGCAALFHVAAPMDLHLSPDQHNIEEGVRSQVLEPAMRGTINVLRSCVRAGTVRRVVFTSSISTMAAVPAVPAVGADGRRVAVVDESCLRALDNVWSTKPIGWIYILSKRLAEEAAFGFARENGIHLVSVVLPTVAGPFLTPSVPTSIQLLLSPITGDPKLYSLLVSVHSRFGSVPLAHIQDACDAHVFLMEAAHAHGRYICAGGSYPMAQIARLLSSQYPPFERVERLSENFDASNSSVVSSKRLVDLGFKFGYDVTDILRDSVAQCVDYGFLEHPSGCR